MLQVESVDPDSDLVRALGCADQVLERALEWIPDPLFDLYRQLRGSCVLPELAGSRRRSLRRDETMLISRHRTLDLSLVFRPWDGRSMPDLPGDDSIEALAGAVCDRIDGTIGGAEFLSGGGYLTKALGVLAHTLTVLFHDARSQRTKNVSRGRVVRAVRTDVYEDAVTELGLAEHFYAIRRVIELDVDGYESSLGLGILSHRGNVPHLALTAPRPVVYTLVRR